MKKILFINACVRPESRTCKLAMQVIAKMSGEIEEVNLEQAGLMPLNRAALQEREEALRSRDFSASSFQYARQFIEADEIVIAAPYWDLSFPSAVKVYFEAVSVCGLSFEYTNTGRPHGLCKAKRIIYVTTAGGLIAGFNLGYEYIKTLADVLYGITEILFYSAENLDIVGADVDKIMTQKINEIKAQRWEK